ncbi:MAG TPA: magnesium transporter CorA [Nitrospiraceae bacterium]|nr:magnesium transporter CorA [Nitrospiraceae bacterium]
MAVFCSSNFIITVHRSEVDFITAMRSKWQAACCDKNINFFLLLDIVRMSIHTYEKPLNDLNLKIDEYEEKLFTTRKDRANVLLIQDLYALKRKASVFHKMLDLTVDTVAQLKTDNNKNRPLIQDIRESANRFFFRANNIVENANNLIGLNLSLSTYRTNEVMRILTIFSVFFMPLTFLVGVYGMNFKHMPELDTAWGYPFAWGLMIVITYSIYRWFRKRGWL